MSYITNESQSIDFATNGRKIIGRCGGKSAFPTPSEMIAEGIDREEVSKTIAGYREFQADRNTAYNRLNNLVGDITNQLSFQEAKAGALGDAPWKDSPITRDAIKNLDVMAGKNRD